MVCVFGNVATPGRGRCNIRGERACDNVQTDVAANIGAATVGQKTLGVVGGVRDKCVHKTWDDKFSHMGGVWTGCERNHFVMHQPVSGIMTLSDRM